MMPVNGRDTFGRETERIRNNFIKTLFYAEDEDQLKCYIRYHQQALIRLMDKAFCFLHQGPLTDHYKPLEELLSFIKEHFQKYFDEDVKRRIAISPS